jgi:glycosyltransferase involved in cell wall biosynthesis
MVRREVFLIALPDTNRTIARAGLVSVVIPCYRGARYLPFAIESCLSQTYERMEVIVVDDASPDDCAAIAQRYAASDDRVRVIERADNGGVSEAFNTGFDASRGQYLTRLAQDDVFREDATECMVSFLEAHPGVALTYCDFQVIDDRGNVIGRRRVPPSEKALRFRNDIGLCVMWRRKVWEALGGFSSDYDTAEDFEYWLRIANRFPIGRCPDCAPMYVRTHCDTGTNRLFDRQETATIGILNLACKQYNTRHRLQRNKGLAYAAFSFASDYSIRGMQPQAVARILRSFVLWPIPFAREETKTRFARPKALAVALRRWLRGGRERKRA